MTDIGKQNGQNCEQRPGSLMTYGHRRRLPEYTVDINFDEASAEWRRNKKQLANGTFVYVCGMTTKNGKPCRRHESHRRFHSL